MGIVRRLFGKLGSALREENSMRACRHGYPTIECWTCKTEIAESMKGAPESNFIRNQFVFPQAR